jgi:FkbM family methyltransferase
MIKKIWKKIFILFSLAIKIFRPNYKKSYSQGGEDLIISHILKILKIEKPTYLDVGAFHPTHMNNTYLFYQKGSSGVCVEPDPYLYKKFRNKRKRDKCLNCGVGANSIKEADFYIISSKTLNTFSEKEARHMEKNTKQKIEKIIKIPLRNINEIIGENFKSRPNIVSIDVEGWDYEIIKTFNFEKYLPEIFCIETITYSETGEEKKIKEIMDFMISKNYFVYADTYINTIFADKQAWEEKKYEQS